MQYNSFSFPKGLFFISLLFFSPSQSKQVKDTSHQCDLAAVAPERARPDAVSRRCTSHCSLSGCLTRARSSFPVFLCWFWFSCCGKLFEMLWNICLKKKHVNYHYFLIVNCCILFFSHGKRVQPSRQNTSKSKCKIKINGESKLDVKCTN